MLQHLVRVHHVERRVLEAQVVHVTWPSGTRAARSTVIVPGPQPTSSTRASAGKRASRYPAEFSAVRQRCDRSTLS